MLLLLSLAICLTLLMMLLLPLVILVHLVPFLINRSLLLQNNLELKFLLLVTLSVKLMIILLLVASRRDYLRMITLCLMMIYAASYKCADSDPAAIKKLLAKHSMKNKFAPDPTFATS